MTTGTDTTKVYLKYTSNLILSEYESFAIDTAKGAGKVLMNYFGKLPNHSSKSSYRDLVTKADLESEDYIIKMIQSTYLNHDVIAEESSTLLNESNDFRWIVDPLDGTTNFVHNLPIFAVSIGLQYKKETVVGVVYNPVYDQCFYAAKGKGAFLNNKPIKVSSCKSLSESLLVTGFPYICDERWTASFRLFEELYGTCQGIRRLGAAALDFCFVAMGRFEGFYEYSLQPWDICAGDLILREAGGKTSDWNLAPLPYTADRVLATNGYIHDEILSFLDKEKYSVFYPTT
ncbi:MAG: hypothetical protein CBD58_01950 [bacterium TMED198]|nr:MAG: hypothetical protein CBD58_01950 [bacterium TMED198]|tara:strand:- start:440 stop:1303 length:864 start_codon:yes stop_codon:yes gene_type:complete